MDSSNHKNGTAQDNNLDSRLQDHITIEYLRLPKCQQAAIDRAAQGLHQQLKELKSKTIAMEILWAIGRRMNEVIK